MYRELLIGFQSQKPYGEISKPATGDQLRQLQSTLKKQIPDELTALLSELNGDGYLLLSTDQMLETAALLRDAWSGIYNDMDSFLFFAENGCGDYYCYRDGDTHSIFIWDHETGETTLLAASLYEFIKRYYRGEI